MRSVCWVTAVALLQGCVSWQPEPLIPERLQPDSTARGTYRVVLRAGGTRIAYQPVLAGDSLVWLEPAATDSGLRVSAPVAEIRKVERRHNSSGTFVLAALALIGVGGMMAFQGLGQ